MEKIKLAVEKMEKEMRLRNYSRRTIKLYSAELESFLSIHPDSSNKIDIECLKKYLTAKLDSGLSSSSVSVAMNAVGWYQRNILKNNSRLDFRFPRKNNRLPAVLTREEIVSIIAVTINNKHKLMLSLAYSAGFEPPPIRDTRIMEK